MMSIEDLVDAWRVNNQLNLELLGICQESDLDLKPGSGKTIRSNFTHLVGTRKTWLADKLAVEAATIPKLDWKTAAKSELALALEVSSPLMVALFKKMEASVKPGKWTTMKFYSYCIAHEAHHRSQVEISLRMNDREPDENFLWGLWDWAKK